MSELKAFVARKIDDGTCDPVPCIEVYSKSEADKVFAELEDKLRHYPIMAALIEASNKEIAELKADYKEACGRLQTANLIKDEQLAATRHQKYKRCLANAEACMHKRWRTDEGFDYARSTRHMNKWLEIAEQFKPNNSTDQ